MKKGILKLAVFVLLLCSAFGGYCITAYAETYEARVYQGESFSVTYKVNDEWGGNTVNAVFEIENTGSKTIENWYLGMSLEGEIGEIWNASIYEHVENQYVIKNAVHNSDIAPGEKISVGCIIEFMDGVQSPEGFYMPIETKEVSSGRYDVGVTVVSSWKTGNEYQISIENASWQTIEDWTMEFDFEGDIISIWNAEIVEKEGSHYRLTNNDYNSVIAYGESTTVGFITADGKAILPKNVTLSEITSEGIKDAEKLVDERNFMDFDFVTEEYEVTPLYTLKGDISAYLVQYYSCGEPTGYVVVSNQRNCEDLYIEFGRGCPAVIYKMIDMIEEECKTDIDRIIYVGGYTYYVEIGEGVYTIQSAEVVQLSEYEEEMLFLGNTDVQYYDGVINLEKLFAKENGYAKGVFKDLSTPLIKDFFTMDETRTAYKNQEKKTITDHCGPTAGLNHLLYLEYKKHPSSLSLADDDWEKSFCTLAAKMETYENKETSIFKYKSAMEDVLEDDSTIKVKNDFFVSWSDVTSYLSKGAVTFLLQDSQIYGDHFVLGVGYHTFEFTSGWKSKYIKIVDGWSDEEYRYVNYSLGIDTIYATVITW